MHGWDEWVQWVRYTPPPRAWWWWRSLPDGFMESGGGLPNRGELWSSISLPRWPCGGSGAGGGGREEKERGLGIPARTHARMPASRCGGLFWKENQRERKRDTTA